MTLQTSPQTRAESRFAGQTLADLFGHGLTGTFDQDIWDLFGHPDVADGGGKRRLHFGAVPGSFRDSLKELVLLAHRPAVHAAPAQPSFTGVAAKNLNTITRWLSHLATDLAWLLDQGPDGSLVSVSQVHADALLRTKSLDHRRTAALKAYGRYAAAMTPTLDRLLFEPWPGQSGLAVAGGLPDRDGRNTTPLFETQHMTAWLETSMLLVKHGRGLIDAATRDNITDPSLLTATGKIRNERRLARTRPPADVVTVPDPAGQPVQVIASDDDSRSRAYMVKYVAAACAFVTVAFTGMRASEFETVPREHCLDDIALAGTRRWLLTSYLTKGMEQPKQESWLVPPIVVEAVQVMQHLLDASAIAPVPHPVTGHPPLFDRSALSVFRESGSSPVMRLSRVMQTMDKAIAHFHALGLVPQRTGPVPNGRQLRRNLTVVVASRPNGPQAAMEQFKWQRAETASGYFRVAPEGVASGQREVYEEVASLHADLVADALHDEFLVWERQVESQGSANLPTGPDGRRKRDMFANVRGAFDHSPRTEEDHRRLRSLLRDQADSMHLTEFGWCDFDESQARCGGIGGPSPSMCEPDLCLNHSTPSSALPAHRVRAQRLLTIANDRTFPALARQRARVGAEAVTGHLGEHLEDPA